MRPAPYAFPETPPAPAPPSPPPEPRLTGWAEYDATLQALREAGAELERANLEVVRLHGRNDTPAALEVLAPLRDR